MNDLIETPSISLIQLKLRFLEMTRSLEQSLS